MCHSPIGSGDGATAFGTWSLTIGGAFAERGLWGRSGGLALPRRFAVRGPRIGCSHSRGVAWFASKHVMEVFAESF